MIKKLTIATIEELKKGEGQNEKGKFTWTLYKITDINGDEFKSFDSKARDLIGKEAEFDVTESKREYKGKFYVDKMIKSLSCKDCPLHCPN